MISLIAALAKNNVIGSKNDLPWYLPEDLKRFRKLTTDQTVLMGRKTFESIMRRNNKPLPNRTNVVVTRDQNYQVPKGVLLYHDIEEALRVFKDREVMIIGGGQIFAQTINKAHQLYITQVDQEIDGDVFFPQINSAVWQKVDEEKHAGFAFLRYVRRQKPD